MKNILHHDEKKVTGVATRARSGFSLLELIIVLIVATLLTSLLLPAMSKLRENVDRVVCSSNLRQIGAATMMFTNDHNDMLPRSVKLFDPVDGPWQPQELMAAHHGQHVSGETGGWDGLGLLYSRGYCAASDCFYCPSHRGEHPAERYVERWPDPGPEPIYMNYHYAGHRHWDGDGLPRILVNPSRMVLATDGLRTASDFNHGTGLNIVYGDASVRWSDVGLAIVPLLPEGEINGPAEAYEYNSIWRTIQGPGLGPGNIVE